MTTIEITITSASPKVASVKEMINQLVEMQRDAGRFKIVFPPNASVPPSPRPEIDPERRLELVSLLREVLPELLGELHRDGKIP